VDGPPTPKHHAVASLSNNHSYKYDANGNQTKRILGADTYDLEYDAENRLFEVKKNGTVVASFVYNGDGKLVKNIIGSETTLFIGGHYEVTNPGAGQIITKYYGVYGANGATDS
jgi:YD repeat-containing protein